MMTGRVIKNVNDFANSAASGYTDEILCTRIYERNREKIKIRKPHLVVKNLSAIVKALLDLSNQKGFHATSLRDLADEAGLSMGGMYSYFDSKETLVVMVLEEVFATVSEVISSAPAQVTEDARNHLLWLIETHIKLTDNLLDWFLFSFMEEKSLPPTHKEIVRASENFVEEAIRRVIMKGTEEGIFRTNDAGFAAALIIPLLQDWFVKRDKYRLKDVDLERYISETQYFVLKSLGSALPLRLASKMAKSEKVIIGT